MRDFIVVLDPAHGEETPGKRSPDGKFREYLWSRMIIEKLSEKLDDAGFCVRETNTSKKEIGLSNRAGVCNMINGKKILISIHSNAAGNGVEWKTATGFSVYTTKGKTKSDKVAEVLMNGFIKDFPELRARMDMSDGDKDTEENFTVIQKANCPAVLIEWMFQDNKDDVEILLSEEYTNRLVDSIYNSIIEIENKKIV